MAETAEELLLQLKHITESVHTQAGFENKFHTAFQVYAADQDLTSEARGVSSTVEDLFSRCVLSQQMSFLLDDLRHEHIVDEYQFDLSESSGGENSNDEDEKERSVGTERSSPPSEVSTPPYQSPPHDTASSGDDSPAKVLRPLEREATVTLLIAGDRGSGKSTFTAALCSGSMRILQALRYHRSEFTNLWFELGDSTARLRSLLSELKGRENGIENQGDLNAGAGGGDLLLASPTAGPPPTTGPQRKLPWLATDLGVGTIEIDPSELNYFLGDDDIIALEANSEDETHRPSALELRRRARVASETLSNILKCGANGGQQRPPRKGLAQHARIRILELGGDLLESMMEADTMSAPPRGATCPAEQLEFGNAEVKRVVMRTVAFHLGGKPTIGAASIAYFVNGSQSFGSPCSFSELLRRIAYLVRKATAPKPSPTTPHPSSSWIPMMNTVDVALLVTQFDASAICEELVADTTAAKMDILREIEARVKDGLDEKLRSLDVMCMVKVAVLDVEHFQTTSDLNRELSMSMYAPPPVRCPGEGFGTNVNFAAVLRTAHRLIVRHLVAMAPDDGHQRRLSPNLHSPPALPWTGVPLQSEHLVFVALGLVDVMHSRRLVRLDRATLQSCLFDGSPCSSRSHGPGGSCTQDSADGIVILPLSRLMTSLANCPPLALFDGFRCIGQFLIRRFPQTFSFSRERRPHDGNRRTWTLRLQNVPAHYHTAPSREKEKGESSIGNPSIVLLKVMQELALGPS